MKLLLGDCLDKLKELEDNSVDSIVTDPPYGLSFMGKKWDYDVPSQAIWEECMRVLKPGGHLLSFAGSRTYHRMAVRIEDAGFEIRDQIMWIYGSGFPKSHNIGKAVDALEKTGKSNPKALREARMGNDYKPTGQIDYKKGRMFSSDIENDTTQQIINNEWEGWGTALKPAHEPIVMARKPFKGNVAGNVLEWGVGGVNIDDSRIDFVSEADKAESINKNQHADFGSTMGSNQIYGDYSMLKPQNYNPTGRFPANVIFDEEAGKILDEQYEAASRFFYCPKASKGDRNEGGDNTHPTVKPTDLMLYLIRLVTPNGGTTLDPFMGSGSTGKAAVRGGFDFIGIEREKEYFQIAETRIDYEIGNPYKEEKGKKVEVTPKLKETVNKFFG
jgi:site-specific DNA-methyltransferase (adenine-specific)